MEEGGTQAGKKAHPGCAIAGIAAFAILFAVSAFFVYKVWVYAGQIRRGEIVDLPQFPSRFTRSASPAVQARTDAAREEVETVNNPELGSEDAKLTIVEFADFQCPYSKESASILRTMAAKYGDRIRVIYRDYPITEIHPYADQLALAAECAREQGRFWQFHDKVFLIATSYDLDSVYAIGDEIGLDGTQFRRCVEEQRYAHLVAADAEAAARLGLAGTPTFFFNGRKVEGSIPEDAFERIIEQLIN